MLILAYSLQTVPIHFLLVTACLLVAFKSTTRRGLFLRLQTDWLSIIIYAAISRLH